MEQEKQPLRGQDIDAPQDVIELDGKRYPIRFDNTTFRVAEDVYELEYKRNLNFADIAAQLSAAKLGALMAIFYGALVAGGADMTWTEFSRAFKLTSIPGVKVASWGPDDYEQETRRHHISCTCGWIEPPKQDEQEE